MAGELAEVVGGFTVMLVVPGNLREAGGLLGAITEMRVRLMPYSKSTPVQLPEPLDLIEQFSALESTYLLSAAATGLNSRRASSLA